MPRLTSSQVAARLGVKRETLYAYVARGHLGRDRDESGGSTFDPLEVEAFAESRRRTSTASSRGGGMPGRPIVVMDSEIALIEDNQLYYRGRSALELARRLTFDEAVSFLWASGAPHGARSPRSDALPRDDSPRDDIDERFVSRREVVRSVRRAIKALGPSARLIDRLSLSTIIAGSWDPVRQEFGPAAVRDAGRQIIATMVDSLPDLRPDSLRTAPLASRLWSKLSPEPASVAQLRLLDAAMVLCLDHDLAISTVAARVAASGRANPYAAVAAALSSFDGVVHGAASVAARAMVSEAERTRNPERAIASRLKETGMIPGFGHVIYTEEDPRARFLFERMRGLPEFRDVMRTTDDLAAVVASRTSRRANLDLALAVLTLGAGMPSDAGELVFAVSRTAGWIAHMIDEYTRPVLRLRPESRYTGVRPRA